MNVLNIPTIDRENYDPDKFYYLDMKHPICDGDCKMEINAFFTTKIIAGDNVPECVKDMYPYYVKVKTKHNIIDSYGVEIPDNCAGMLLTFSPLLMTNMQKNYTKYDLKCSFNIQSSCEDEESIEEVIDEGFYDIEGKKTLTCFNINEYVNSKLVNTRYRF